MSISFKYLSFKNRICSAVRFLIGSILLTSSGIASAQQCTVIYVTPNGASSGTAGTKAAPASLAYALTLATAADNKIFIASGTYNISNPLVMLSNLTIEGGYNSSTWKKSNSGATTIFRNNSNLETNPNRLVAIYCSSISNFRFQDLTIRTANAFGGGISTYGIHMSGCSNYQIVRCKITAGNAGNGTSGTNGTSGLAGANGLIGKDGSDHHSGDSLGGAGGSGTFPGSLAGGNGGSGGDRGTAACSLCGDPAFATNGYHGQNGQVSGSGGGYGGGGGQKIVTCIFPTTPPRTGLNDGIAGTDGADGLAGLIGSNGTASFSAGFYVPGDGLLGSDGTVGSGGGGGGGGGSIGGIPHDCFGFPFPPNLNGTGAGGGGGGEGGQSAIGGIGGTGGGGSFAIYTYNNGANGILKDTKLTSGAYGLGGAGGSGGTGGTGGLGGPQGGYANGYVGAGGNGGKGGKGGDGGDGGDGSDGLSATLYEDGSGTAVTEQNVYSLQQPFVFVQYSGCTNAPVIFSTNATGTVIWFFGAGATPASGSGITATTKYTTQGRKTFTMVNNGISYTYTDFIEIFNSGSGFTPAISTTNTPVCKGGTHTFSCSATATDYEWYFIRNNVTDTVTGPAFQNVTHTFDSAGTYMVILKSIDYCCGESFPDTVSLTVGNISRPTVSIQSENSSNVVCSNGTFNFSAAASNAGTAPGYQWLINGSPAGGNYPVFVSSTLGNADSVTCIVTSALGCSTGQKDTSNSIYVTVINPPVVTCSADSFFSGDPTRLIAHVTSGWGAPYTYNWGFGDASLGLGDTVSHIYQAAGTYNYQVNVSDSNGCTGSCSGTVLIATRLNAAFEASVTSGCEALMVHFTNASVYAITYLWNFGDGTSSVLANPSHLYTNSGIYNVKLRAFSATGMDSAVVSSQVFVYARPVANFQAFMSLSGDTAHLADNSIDAWTWLWNFGDGSPASTIQNPVHFYSVNGNYTISLIVTNVHGCSDTTDKPAFVKIQTGIDNLSFDGLTFTVFPNPFSSEININAAFETESTLKISLMNLEGQRIISENKNCSKGPQQIKVEGIYGRLSPGMYLLEVEYKGKKQYTKLIYQE